MGIHFSLFLFFSLCVNAEYAMGIVEAQQIGHLTNGALITLGHYSLQRMEWTRFGKLLLGLRCLALKQFDATLKQLFNSIIEDIIEQND